MNAKLLGTISWGLFIWTSIEWAEQNPNTWATSLIPLFVFVTWSSEYNKMKYFPRISKNYKEYTDDYCFQFNGYLLALACRIIALVLAIIQILVINESIKWKHIVKDLSTELPSDFSTYYIFAAVASMFYAFSGIILCISLCQCAVTFRSEEKITILSWGLHDLILGFIWEALSLQFHDIVDDKDDSHWRALFSSMIVFHILTLLFNIWNNKTYNIQWFKNKNFKLCSEQTKSSLLMLIRFLLYCVIYFWILNRLHQYDKMLIAMGWNNWAIESIIASSVLIILINILDDDKQEHEKPTANATVTSTSVLYF